MRRRQREKTSSTASRVARGARTNRRSPGSTIVLPRGGIESSPREMTATIVLRGRPSSRTALPAIECSAVTLKSMSSSWLTALTSIGASCRGRGGVRSASRAATRSNVVPCRVAETTTTKNTTLKMVLAWGTFEERTKVASTIGTAPRSPPHPRSSRSRELNPFRAVDAQTATGRIRTTSNSASTRPARATSASWRGKTSRPSTMNSATCARKASPSWNATSCRR